MSVPQSRESSWRSLSDAVGTVLSTLKAKAARLEQGHE
jgi:hypothetical protein